MVIPEGTVKYFEKPTQVAWFDGERERWTGGIGVDDYVICSCCGNKVPLNELYEAVEMYNFDHPTNPKKPIVFLKWIDINEEIIGDLDL